MDSELPPALRQALSARLAVAQDELRRLTLESERRNFPDYRRLKRDALVREIHQSQSVLAGEYCVSPVKKTVWQR